MCVVRAASLDAWERRRPRRQFKYVITYFTMNDHDHSYKNLFSHAQMVEDLLRGFVREDWVQQRGAIGKKNCDH